MPERIPAATAIRVPLQAYLSSDHVSPASGKTIAIQISKNGAAYGNPNAGATNATGIANGSYYVDLDTTDTGTAGPLFVRGTEGTIDAVVAIYHVVAATNGGFTALPAVVAGANGGVPLVGSQVPNATAGAANGLLISGSNSGTTTFGALTVTGATTLTGNVTLSGTLGVGATTLSALTVTNNLLVSGTTTYTGATTYTGNVAYSNGIFVAGGSQVHAVRWSAAAGGHGLYSTGSTVGHGAMWEGGADGDGTRHFGGSNSGNGYTAIAGGAGIGAQHTGTNSGHGAAYSGDLAGGGMGILCSGFAGMWLAGTEGLHIQTNNTNERAVFIQGGGDTTSGIIVTGGVQFTGADIGDALELVAKAASNGNGLSAVSDGTGLDITAPVNDLGTSISDDVWDELLAGHAIPGSAGAALAAAGGAADPLMNPVPGAYAAGTAGFVIGTNLDVAVSTRLAAAGYTVPPTAAANATAVLTTAMTESYRANGAAPTLAQAQFEALAHLGEAAIVGTTKTINQIDHVTPAETFTLDNGTLPTTITRAT